VPNTSPIIIANAIPEDVTFDPQSASLAQSTWRTSDGTIFAGHKRLAVSLSLPSKSRHTTRVKSLLTLPVERVNADGETTVVGSRLYIAEAVIPEICTPEEMAEGEALQRNLMANAIIQGYFASQTAVY